MSMGDRIGVLNDGRLVQVGTPNEIYNAPRDTFVATFVGSPAMNLLEGVVEDGRLVVPGGFAVPLAEAGRARLRRDAGPLTVGVRAEDIVVGSGEGRALVHHVENHGVELVVTLRAGEKLLKATAPAVARLGIDDEVPFALDQAKLHGFDATTGLNLARGS
jgi:multiple sugar transport system ATP-binding protein